MTPTPKLSTPTLASLPIVVQTLFTSTADELALTHKVIQRQQVLSGSSIAQTLALGWLEKPDARLSDLARTAAMIGSPVTKQAIAQRLEQASLSAFLQALFEHASSFLFAGERSFPTGLLEFEDIDLCDGSIINLPSEHHQRYPGCGAFGQANYAGLKLLTKFSLRSGTLHTELRPAREHDRVNTAACSSKAKTLQLRDLGFFNLRVLAAEDRAGIYWITRVKQGTRIYQRDGRVIDNLAVWLQQHACPAGRVDISILLGAKQRLACRLVATRVPAAVLEARMQKALLEARKRQRVADHFMRENLAWNVRVTNLAVDQISADDVFTVYRLRWQIELLFKLLKSELLVDESRSINPQRRLSEILAKLLGALVQHWFVLLIAWQDLELSLVLVSRAVRSCLALIVLFVRDDLSFEALSNALQRSISAGCSLDKRRLSPSSAQLMMTIKGLT